MTEAERERLHAEFRVLGISRVLDMGKAFSRPLATFTARTGSEACLCALTDAMGGMAMDRFVAHTLIANALGPWSRVAVAPSLIEYLYEGWAEDDSDDMDVTITRAELAAERETWLIAQGYEPPIPTEPAMKRHAATTAK